MLIIKSENKDEFRTVIKKLNASNITVSYTRTPGYFALGRSKSLPGFFLFLIVLIGITLGIFLVLYINSVWTHQIGNKPQNLSGIFGWLPVIFEITILFTVFVYFVRFIFGITKKEKEDPANIDPTYYYCFLYLNNKKDIELIIKTFKTFQIIEC